MKNKNQMLFLAVTFTWLTSFSVSRAAETFTLGYTNLRGAKVPLPLGVDEGIFARHGIELKMVPVSPGTLGVPKLLAGEITLFLGNSEPVVREIAVEGKNLAVIAHLGSEGFTLFSRPGITKVEDLRGKKIGSSVDGASVDRNTKKALRKLGLDPEKDVTMVYTGFQNSSDRLKVLAKGEVDATVGGADALPDLGKDMDKVHPLLDLVAIGIAVSGADISAERNFIGKKREALRDFVRGLEESFRLARARPDLVRRTYEKHLKISSSLTLDWMVKDYMSAKVPARPAPNPRVIEAYLEELQLKKSDVPKDVNRYLDASLF
ncbi:MAG TPA: ABC transporter substrate-binding protein [Candidatus Binatia bacterium]|nr:ABC transporter substrate-binding protein [Candidatus Binatia bacterium]